MIGYVVLICIWIVVSIFLAFNKDVQRWLLTKGFDIKIGEPDKSTVEPMKQLAKEVLDSQQIPTEQSKDYTIITISERGHLVEVSVRTERTIVTVNDEELQVLCIGISKSDAIFKTALLLMVFGIIGITIVYAFLKPGVII